MCELWMVIINLGEFDLCVFRKKKHQTEWTNVNIITSTIYESGLVECDYHFQGKRVSTQEYRYPVGWIYFTLKTRKCNWVTICLTSFDARMCCSLAMRSLSLSYLSKQRLPFCNANRANIWRPFIYCLILAERKKYTNWIDSGAQFIYNILRKIKCLRYIFIGISCGISKCLIPEYPIYKFHWLNSAL